MPFRLTVLLMAVLSASPAALQAEIKLPSCERLEQFFLKCGGFCETPEDIFETFGTDPRDITDADIDTIEASVFECALRVAPGQYARYNIDDTYPELAARSAATSLAGGTLEIRLQYAQSTMDSQEAQKREDEQIVLELSEIIENIPMPENVGPEMYFGIEQQQARRMSNVDSYLRGWRGETADPLVGQLIENIRSAERMALRASYIVQIERIEALIPSVEAPNAALWPGLTHDDKTLLRDIRDGLRFSDWAQIDMSDIARRLDAIQLNSLNVLAVKSEEEIIVEESEFSTILGIFYLTADLCMQYGVAFDRADLPILDAAFDNILTSRSTSDAAREMGQRNARRAFEVSGVQNEITKFDCTDLRQDLVRAYGISF